MAESIAGFWSYVHADDEAEGGRIIGLADRLAAEYEISTAAPLSLFVDRHDLRWGDAWRERIESALIGTTFFIPIVTPRYFRSHECRRELLTFWAQAQRSKVGRLLLPVS
ncbi:MAG: toll/interleukin-1 receptor domain-containing protein [Solirubrobacteraceae bacterium]